MKACTIYVNEMTLKEISEQSNISVNTIYARYRKGARSIEELTDLTRIKNPGKRLRSTCGSGKRFLEHIVDNNIPVTLLQEKTGITRGTINRFIYNNADISSLKLAKLCAAAGISMDYVMGLKGGDELVTY